MNPLEEHLCARLLKSNALSNEEDVAEFVATARQLPITDNPEVLDVMLKSLNAIEAGEVQYELIEAIERFPDPIYASKVLRNASALVEKAGHWGWMVVQTMLNTESSRAAAAEEFTRLSPEQKMQFRAVLLALAKGDDRYSALLRQFPE